MGLFVCVFVWSDGFIECFPCGSVWPEALYVGVLLLWLLSGTFCCCCCLLWRFAPSRKAAEPLGRGRRHLPSAGCGSVPRLRHPPACAPPAPMLPWSAAPSPGLGMCMCSPGPAARRGKLPNLHFRRLLRLQSKAPSSCNERGIRRGIFESAGGAVGNFLPPRESKAKGIDAVLQG